MDETLAQLAKIFHDLLTKNPRFFGNVKVNFQNGKVINLNKEESVKLDKPADVVQW